MMRGKRIVLFILMMALGISLGLLYGWVLNPVQYADTALDSLRFDYQADYLLMVAQIYQDDQDIEAALRRLALVGDRPPAGILNEAIENARRLGYGARDLETMGYLAQALEGLPSLAGGDR